MSLCKTWDKHNTVVLYVDMANCKRQKNIPNILLTQDAQLSVGVKYERHE